MVPIKHPLDIDIYDMAYHMRTCKECRTLFARALYLVENKDTKSDN